MIIIITMLSSCGFRTAHFGIDCELTFGDVSFATTDNCQVTKDALGQLIKTQLLLEHGKRGFRMTNKGKYIVGNIKTTKRGDVLYERLFNHKNYPAYQFDKIEQSTAKYYSFDNLCDGYLYVRLWIMTEYVNRYCINSAYQVVDNPTRMTDCLNQYATDPDYVSKINKLLKQNGYN